MSNWLKDFGNAVSSNLKESIMSWPNDMGFTSLNPNQALGNMIGAVTGQNRAFDAQMELNRLQMQREDNAYQRMSADMKAAGLNPAGAISSGGSSAGGMSSASIDNSSMIGNALGLFQSIENAKLRNKELDIQDKLAKAEIDNKKADTANKQASADTANMERPYIEKEMQARIAKLETDTELSKSEREYKEKLTEELTAKIANLDAETALVAQQTALALAQASSVNNAEKRAEELHRYAKMSAEAKAHNDKTTERYYEDKLKAEIGLDKTKAWKLREEAIAQAIDIAKDVVVFGMIGAKMGWFAGPHGAIVGGLSGATFGLLESGVKLLK